MECAPGDEAQVDFGTGIPILMPDGKRRRTHVFRIVLSHSRKGYSEAVYRQTSEGSSVAWKTPSPFSRACPRLWFWTTSKPASSSPRLVRSELNPKLRSFADQGLWSGRLAHQAAHCPDYKGKIESGVGFYVKGNALKGHTFTSLEEQNRHLLAWETTVADVRIHGTIRQQVEQIV